MLRSIFALALCIMSVQQVLAQGLIGGAIEGLCGNCGAGRALDEAHDRIGSPLDVPGRITREAAVETLGPVLAEAIRHSRDDARRAGVQPIPRQIRQELIGFYSASFLDSVRFRVGQGHELSVQANSIRFGDAAAVALIDTIIFANSWDARNNLVLWAHELRHIDQYRRWGLTDFGKRYVRSHRRVEEEAERAEQEFKSWRNQTQSVQRGFQSQAPTSTAASVCVTNWGLCQMGIAIPVGSNCYCPSFQGPLWGIAQ